MDLHTEYQPYCMPNNALAATLNMLYSIITYSSVFPDTVCLSQVHCASVPMCELVSRAVYSNQSRLCALGFEHTLKYKYSQPGKA